MILEKYQMLYFFQIYRYFFVITDKYNDDLLQRTSYKRLQSFQFWNEGEIKMMELCTTALFIYLHSSKTFSEKQMF